MDWSVPGSSLAPTIFNFLGKYSGVIGVLPAMDINIYHRPQVPCGNPVERNRRLLFHTMVRQYVDNYGFFGNPRRVPCLGRLRRIVGLVCATPFGEMTGRKDLVALIDKALASRTKMLRSTRV